MLRWLAYLVLLDRFCLVSLDFDFGFFGGLVGEDEEDGGGLDESRVDFRVGAGLGGIREAIATSFGSGVR